MDIDEYIIEEDSLTQAGEAVTHEATTQAKQDLIESQKKKSRRAKVSTTSPRMKEAILADNHELKRKRDILASVALLDGLKSYIGKNISAAQIRNMKKEKLESYFLLYQEKSGQESTNEMMSSLVEMLVKGLSYVVDIDNQEDLKNDLINNKQLRRTIGKQAAEFTEKYGDFVAIFKVLFTVGKHLSFSAPASTISAPASTISAEKRKSL